MSVMHWPFCPAVISCFYQHINFILCKRTWMDGWMCVCVCRRVRQRWCWRPVEAVRTSSRCCWKLEPTWTPRTTTDPRLWCVPPSTDASGSSRCYWHVPTVIRLCRTTSVSLLLSFCLSFNPLMGTGNYGAISNNMKLVHWPLMDGLLHLIQRGWHWAETYY